VVLSGQWPLVKFGLTGQLPLLKFGLTGLAEK